MKITLIAVQSLDGKITKWEDAQDVSTWASSEDQEFFMTQITKHKVIIMGRKTYEVMKGKFTMKEGRRRIIMTHHPEDFKTDEVAGQVEFTSETPQELTKRLKVEKYDSILVAGGTAINTAFLKAGLIDEIYLTIEPKIFGEGKVLTTEEKFNINLKLKNIKQLRDEGTILLHWEVIH